MKWILSAVFLLSLVSCEQQESSDSLQNKKQEEMNKQAVESVGMPAITRFQEKRTLKDILELRDKAISTYTYTIAEQTGKRVFLCNSIGFGISAATQYTNPQRISYSPGGTPEVIPQADPNGLYSPASAEGTWVMCLNPETKKPVAMYVEPRIIVSQFKLSE